MDYAFTYTLKYPTKANPWLVLKSDSADTLKKNIASAFGQPAESVADMSLHDVVIMVDDQMAGREPVKQVEAPPKDVPQAQGEPGDLPVVESDESLLERIKVARSEAELDNLWLDNQSDFMADHIAAAKKRTAELKGE